MISTQKAAAPLAGTLVLDLSQGVAGPYCGRLLADHGARVIKVEPPQGDWMRALGPGPQQMSASSIYYNLGKESLVLDLKSPDGLARALVLAARADVLIESARPGAMEKLGLGFEAVRAVNPAILYVSVSGFGLAGPRASERMTDTVAQAFSGYMSINRGRDGIPHKTDTTVIDAVTGLYGFQAVSMALWPDQPRKARRLDIALMQSAAAILGPKILETAHHGQAPAPINAPAGSYQTSDGWVAVTLVREENFVALAGAVGRPDLPGNKRFASFPARAENLAALLDILAERFATKSTDDWVARLTKAGVLASRINGFGDWLNEPQVAASAAAPNHEVLPGAMLPVPRNPGQPGHTRPAPALGQHGAAILREFEID